MPLSEHEQRLLDEMERNLYQNDADFVEPAAARGRFDVAMLTVGALVALVGLGVVLLGVGMQLPIVGIAGFVVMLVGVLVATRPSRPRGTDSDSAPRGGSAGGPSSPSFMDRLDERWQKRLDERGGA